MPCRAASMPRSATRGPAAVSRAPPARERSEHLVRQPHRQRGRADRRDHRRPGAHGRRVRHLRPSPHRATARHLPAGAQELRGRTSRQRRRCCAAMAERMERVSRRSWVAGPLVGGDERSGPRHGDPQSGRSRRPRGQRHGGDAAARSTRPSTVPSRRSPPGTPRPPKSGRTRSTGPPTCSRRTCPN